jgi:hydroxyacylglutathione hydrolase
MILKKFVCGSIQNNVILLADEETKEAVVVDPSEGAFATIIPFVEKLDLLLKKILLTHSHWDHIFEACLFKKEKKIPIWIHEEDAPNLEDPGYDKIPFPKKIMGCKADHYVKDHEEFFVGKIHVRVLHTPGHTPGSVCYYLPKEGILLSGDTLFRGCIGTLAAPNASTSSMWKSCKKLSLLPLKTRVIPGHGLETEIGRESWLSRAEEFFS